MLREFFKLEAEGRILFGFAVILALVMKNSPLRYLYDAFLTTLVAVQIVAFIIYKPLLLWINDGLMAIFFLFISLKIKREVLEGQLSSQEQVIILPALFALVGITAPALIYDYINGGNAEATSWWAIFAATDITVALCVIILLGNRVPKTLKICLIAIAIIADLAAIIIICLFYTDNLLLLSLRVGAIASAILLAVLNRKRVVRLTPYILVGIVLWSCVLKSAVHATLAGIVIAMFIPLKVKNKVGGYPVCSLEHGLHPWIAYAVFPVFALLLMPEFHLLGYCWRF